jgi:acetolactate synthase I/II/III large subunit
VSDEAQTSGVWAPGATAGAPRHDWLTLCGGAIGQGMPLATGAAVACPDRPVINLQADGSGMYTLQSLWTQAREGLDVTTIMCSNHAYAILQLELSRVGVEQTGPRAEGLLDLSTPPIDFAALARGMGVPATRPADAGELVRDLKAALAEPGPHLIDVEIGRS